MQEYCDAFEGQPMLAISSETFKNSGLVEETLYDFTVETFSLNIGGDPSDEVQIFSKMIQIEWDNVKQPVFSLETPDSMLVT